MAKLILLSVLVATMVIPILASRDRNPRRAVRRTVFFVALFNMFYAFGVLVIYPHLVFK